MLISPTAESKRKHLLKSKGIKVAPKTGKAAPVATTVKQDQDLLKIPKGKKVTEKRMNMSWRMLLRSFMDFMSSKAWPLCCRKS